MTIAHNMFHTGPVIPAAVKEDDFTGSREVVQVALYVHL
jgi:hypothetical protein